MGGVASSRAPPLGGAASSSVERQMRMQRVQHDLARFLDAACGEPFVREPLFGAAATAARAGATPSGLSEAAEREALGQRRRFDAALSNAGASPEIIVYETGADLEAALGTGASA